MALSGLTTGTAFARNGTTIKDTLTVIHERKSVRNFTGEAVDKVQLETIVRAGMAAPTAVNKQPWSFVIISDRAQMDKLTAVLPYAKMLAKAGAAIVVCAEPKRAYEEKTEFAIIDASLAGENILLAAEALNLGSVWTAAYPDPDLMAHVRNALGIPADVIPLAVMPVGHPTGEDKPKNKYNKDKIHWSRW